jgi:photosystem II stability/assembly factor-like uncharacterized protein
MRIKTNRKLRNIIIGTVVLILGVANIEAAESVLKGAALFGDMKARQIGPAVMSGRVNDIEAHPTNPRVIYVGAAGGGVWRSQNGGASFEPIFDKHVQSIGVISVDPVEPDKIIWVGTGETWTRNSVSTGDGLFKSIDGGINWKNVGFKKSERISSVEINPNNHDEVYVGVLGALWGDSTERGVYKTKDGGKTWEQILYVDAGTGCGDVVMDPNDPNILYASMWEFRRTAWSFNSGGSKSALYKSSDSGVTWKKIHNGFPKGKLGRIAIAVAPSDSKVLYSVLETEKGGDKGLYRSDDAGKSWKHLNGDFGLVVRPFYFSRIVVDPRNPEVVVKAGFNGSISRDGGRTFKNLGPMHPDIHDVLFDINDSDRMYVGTDGGVYRTWDGATTMEIVANLPISQYYHVSVDNETPYNIYGGLQDNGSWYGPSYSPGGIEARDWNNIGFGDGFRVLRHPTKKIIYSEMQGAQNVWRYDVDRDEVKTIQPLKQKGDPKLRFNWNAPMSLSEINPDRLYMGSQFLYRSDDTGLTWNKISPDLTTNDPSKQNQEDSGGLSKDNSGAENYETIFTIAESPLDENVIWVGTDDGQVQITKNGGKKWTNVVKNIPNLPTNTWVYHIEASVHGKGSAYAVFDGHTANDTQPYIYKTTDFGKTWQSIVTDDIQGFSRSLQEDTINPNLLFAGTERGLFVTIDGGKNWSQFNNNMPHVAVHYMVLQKQTNDLVMATHGRGVIIVDDISPLRQITPDILSKKVYFFKPKPMIINEESGFGGNHTEMEYVGPNPDRNAKIVYYLKKRHIFGKTKMQVFNTEGAVIADLPASKSKGINTVSWNGHLKRPKMAKAKTFAFGGFTTPRVPAGNYKVVFTKGKETYETQVVLMNDPDSPYTDEQRQELYKVTMELYDMVQDLAYLVYKIDAYIDSANKLSDNTSQKLVRKLTDLKKTLVITTGDNYVGSADPQLREDMADLYSKIANGFAPPSRPELVSLALIKKRFEDAKKAYAKIENKEIKKFLKQGHEVEIETFTEFVK